MPIARWYLKEAEGKTLARRTEIAYEVATLDEKAPIFSYGFRPGRSAHQALLQAKEHVASGRRWVVDVDLEKFFDRVQHDVLMSRVARKVGDKQVLCLIRRYSQAGVMQDGLVSRSGARLKVVHCRHCCRTSCWTNWTRNSKDEGTGSVVMPTMVHLRGVQARRTNGARLDRALCPARLAVRRQW